MVKHPTIDGDYYKWLGACDKVFVEKMLDERSWHGLLMYAFQAGRTTIDHAIKETNDK